MAAKNICGSLWPSSSCIITKVFYTGTDQIDVVSLEYAGGQGEQSKNCSDLYNTSTVCHLDQGH